MIFDITDTDAVVTIAGLTIEQGTATSGGGIEDLGASLSLVSPVALTGNTAVGSPGDPLADDGNGDDSRGGAARTHTATSASSDAR